MTIIAVHGRMMVADSRCFSSGLSYPMPADYPKIIRAPDGSLVGAGGSHQQCFTFCDWVRQGMDFEKQPKFAKVKDEDDNISWLWLRRDGRAFVGDANLDYYESASPTNIGIVHACNYWMGAVHACGDPVRALQLTLQHCEYVGGEPQVEYL